MMTDRTLYTDAPPEDPAKGLSIRIYMSAVENKELTKANGYPTFEDVPFIHVRIPGDTTTERHGRITEEEKQMYSRHWARFLENQKSEGVVGQVLEEWSQIPRSVVESYRHFGVRTVEQLAGLPDQNAAAIPQGKAFREKAKAWLANAKAAAPFAKLEADNKDLSAQVDALRKQLNDAMAALDSVTAPKRKTG